MIQFGVLKYGIHKKVKDKSQQIKDDSADSCSEDDNDSLFQEDHLNENQCDRDVETSVILNKSIVEEDIEKQKVEEKINLKIDLLESSIESNKMVDGKKALHQLEDLENNNNSEIDDEYSAEATTPTNEPGPAAVITAGFVPGHVTLETLQNTKVAVAQFAANTLANNPDNETALKELAMLQSTLFTLQHQQVFQMQLIHQLQSQLSMGQLPKDTDEEDARSTCSRNGQMDTDYKDEEDEENEDDEDTEGMEMPVEVNIIERAKSEEMEFEKFEPKGESLILRDKAAEPILNESMSKPNHENTPPIVQTLVPSSVNQPPRIPSPIPVPQHCHISALSGIITNHDPPPSMDEPNTLEMLQKRAQEVLDSASQGLLAGNLADELAFRKDKMYPYDGKGNKNEPFLKHRCRYCGKVFGSDSALQIHLRSHTGERPFKCNVCGSRFTTKGNLKVHFQRHTSNFPHVQMNPNPIPEHLDKYHPPLLAQLSPGAPPQHPQIPHHQSVSVPISASSGFSSMPLYRPPMELLKSMGGHSHSLFGSDTQDVPADLSKPISSPTPLQQEMSKDIPNIKMEPEDEDADEFIQHEDTESPEELEERLIREAREEREELEERREREEMERLEKKKLEIEEAEREEIEKEHKLHLERQRIMAIERELFLKRERELQREEAEREEKEEKEDADRYAMTSNFDENSVDSKFSDNIRDSRSEQDQPENLSKSQLRSPSSRNSSMSGRLYHGGPPPDPTKDPVIYSSLLPRPGSNDNSWESLIEVTKTSTTSQLQKLVDNIEQKLTDPNQCIVCHQVLSCKSALQMHYRTHTGERPFRCRICGRAFTTKGNLKTHMGVHRMKPPIRTPHQCPVCHKKYSNALVLQQHIRMHTGEPTDLTAEQIQAAEVREFPSLSPGAFPMGIGPFGFPFPGLPHSAMRSGSSQGDIDDFMDDDEDFDDDKSNSDDHNNTENESVNSHPSLLNMSRSSVDLEKHVRAITTMASQLSASEFNNTVAKARSRNEKYLNESNSLTPTRSSPTPSDASQGALDLTPRSNNTQKSPPMLQGPSPIGMFPNFPMLPHGPVATSPLMRNALNSLSQSVMPNSPFNTMGLAGVRGNTTCNICFKTFACNSALDIHYRSHTKERPFKCTICDRGFSTKSEELAHTSFHLSCRRGNMKQHMLTHKIRDMPNHMFGGSNSNSNSSDGTHMSSSSHNQSSQSQSIQQQRQQSPHLRIKSEVSESSCAEQLSNVISNHESESNQDQPSHNDRPSVLLEPLHIKQEPGLKRSPSEIENQPLPKRPSTIASGPLVPPFFNPGGAPSLVQTYIYTMSPRSDDTQSPIDMSMQPIANSSPVHQKNQNDTETMLKSPNPVRDISPQRELNQKSPKTVCSPEFKRDDILSPRSNSPIHSMEEFIGESPLAQLSQYQQQYHQQQQEQQKLQQQQQQEQLHQQQLIDAESPNSKHLCTVCRKNFSSSSALQIHMRTHTGDKPFRCSVCEKAFTTKGNLKVHMGTHMWSNAASRRGRRMSLELPLNRPLPLSPQHSEFLQRRPELFYPYLQAPFLNGMHQKLNEMNALQQHAGHGVHNLSSPQHSMANKYAGLLGFNGFLPGQNRELYSPSPSPVSDMPPSSISPSPNGNNPSDMLSSPSPSLLSPQSNVGIESTQLKATIPTNPSLKRMWELHYDRKPNDSSPTETSTPNSSRKGGLLLTPTTCREGLAA